MAARAGVEPMTLRTKGVDSTKAPPTPLMHPLAQWFPIFSDSRTTFVSVFKLSDHHTKFFDLFCVYFYLFKENFFYFRRFRPAISFFSVDLHVKFKPFHKY